MRKTLESEIAEMKQTVLGALRAGDELRPEVFVAAMADLIGFVCADLTVTGREGGTTLDHRMDLFMDRAKQAYRRRITSVHLGPCVADLNGRKPG